MLANYFFVDGSALRAQIRNLRRVRPVYRNRRLCPVMFAEHFSGHLFADFHQNEYKRLVFYFPDGDQTAIEEDLIVPDRKKPGEVRDIHFKFCGQKLKKSAEFAKFVEEVVPPKFQDRFSKSEKGIDIEICCDGLKLASASRLERLFLLTNDDDFIPFCRTVKEFGANISIMHLSEDAVSSPNLSLLREADSYHVFPDDVLNQMFLPVPDADGATVVDPEPPVLDGDKPDAMEGTPSLTEAEIKEEELESKEGGAE